MSRLSTYMALPTLKGSNANGEWIKFSDGTQICTLYAGVTPVSIGTNVEQPIPTWTYPAAFAATPVFTGQASGTNSGFFVVRSVNPTATTVGSLFLINLASATKPSPPNLNLMAIGRWF